MSRLVDPNKKLKRIGEALKLKVAQSGLGDSSPDNVHEFEALVNTVLDEVGRMLVAKNQAYGNSALNPVRVFSKADAAEQLRVRIDDKLSRLARGKSAGEDTVLDLIGYLILLRITNNVHAEPVGRPTPAKGTGSNAIQARAQSLLGEITGVLDVNYDPLTNIYFLVVEDAESWGYCHERAEKLVGALVEFQVTVRVPGDSSPDNTKAEPVGRPAPAKGDK